MILCSQRYCHFPPKYLVDTYHDKIQLMCGVCLNSRKNWLSGSYEYYNEVQNPLLIQISNRQYQHHGFSLQFYKLNKDDLKFLSNMEESQ
jgi:hypothetical protein